MNGACNGIFFLAPPPGALGRDQKVKYHLKTYAAISNAHLSRVWKRVKLSGSCLSTINGFGSTKLSDILMSYRCSEIFLTKERN